MYKEIHWVQSSKFQSICFLAHHKLDGSGMMRKFNNLEFSHASSQLSSAVTKCSSSANSVASAADWFSSQCCKLCETSVKHTFRVLFLVDSIVFFWWRVLKSHNVTKNIYSYRWRFEQKPQAHAQIKSWNDSPRMRLGFWHAEIIEIMKLGFLSLCNVERNLFSTAPNFNATYCDRFVSVTNWWSRG